MKLSAFSGPGASPRTSDAQQDLQYVRDCTLQLTTTTVSRGAVCIFLLQPVAPGALKSAPGLPRPKNVIFLIIFNIGIALSGAPLRKVIFQAGFPWASVGVSGRICSRLYAQMARIADLFETVRPDCNNNGSVRDCTLKLQKYRICSRLYAQIATTTDLFDTVHSDCNK